MPLSKVHNTLTSDHILLNGTDSTGANANSKVLLDASASNTDIGSIMSFESGAGDGSNVVVNTNLNKIIPNVTDFTPTTGNFLTTGSAGAIVQVVQGTTSTQVISTTNALAETGLSATITPTSSSNKILVIVQQSGCMKDTNNTYGKLILRRNTTEIVTFENQYAYDNTNGANCVGGCGGQFLDSPATTSATTYKTQFRSQNNNSRVFVQAGNETSTITLLEVIA